MVGNEITTKEGHFNIFPIAPGEPVVDPLITDWPALMASIREKTHARVILLNHPRSIHTAFRPFDPTNFNAATGDNLHGPEFSFNAIELLNSGAQQTDYLRVCRDWFALLNHGYRITAVGASDSHDVSRFIVGQSRTYISTLDDSPANIDVGAACKNLQDGRALVSMGLLVQLRIEDRYGVGDLATALPYEIRVEARVSGPSWVAGKHVTLFANGFPLREADIADIDATRAGKKAVIQWTIPRPAQDVHLVAIAVGPAVTAPYWAMTKPYQPSSPLWEGRSIGVTNPIWIDADDDGRFTPARGYAEELVRRHGHDFPGLVKSIEGFDEATAAQVASVCEANGIDLHAPGLAEIARGGAPQVARGFASYLEGARKVPKSNER